MADGTAALRAAAPRWSLAGDQQLLDILQNIHQRILSKCNETTARLEEMSRGLRDASVNLQNVNNKFLALSNTQFVESRVYDDDIDMTAAPGTRKEPPQLTDLSSDLSKLKQSLQILESYHEPLHILRDSDSDSDSDGGDDRLVLKPKDLYSDRPLPYIIGSQAWRSKWHAGLVVESSDSDSSVSRAEEAEQFSDSEGEGEGEGGRGTEYPPDTKISAGSSSLHSEVVSLSPERPSPSAVAAELARRLGGGAKVPETEPVYTEPDPVVRKLYKPQQPVATTIFPEEPPPLDETSSDEDIFAELHKTRPTARSDTVQNDLFDFTPKTNSLEEALFGRKVIPETNQTVKNKPALFDDEEAVKVPQEREKEREDNIKKPVGGISLFGTNQHAESIGAAILRRNRRKSSNSDESNTEEVPEVKDVKEVPEVKKERDIFDDLFAKSEKLNKKSAKINVAPPKEEVKKKDAFSDLFDDIDDIFSTDIVNVQIKETKKDEKPLFTDDDDLFVEISKVKKATEKETAKVIDKSNLFDNVAPKVDTNVIKDQNQIQNKVVNDIRKESKGLFDSDSDDGLFTNATKNNAKEKGNKSLNPVEHKITNDNIFGESDEGDDLFAKNKSVINKEKEQSKNLSKDLKLSKNVLFDSDDEMFNKNDKENTVQEEKGRKNNLNKSVDVSKNALFDSDEELFTNNRKDTENQRKEDKSHVSKAEASSKNNILDFDEELFTNNRKDFKTQEKDENHVSKSEAPSKNALLDSDDQLFTNNVKEPGTKELEIDKNDTSNENDEATIVNTLKKPETESFDKNDDDPAEDLFKSKEKSKALKVIESINNDIFNDGDELFKNSETSNKSKMIDSHDSFENKSIESKNESSRKSTQGDTQSDVDSGNQFESEQPQSDIFNHPDEQTTNILRTTRIASDKENIQTDRVDLIDDSDDELFKKSHDPTIKESEVTTNDFSRNLLEPVSQDSKAEENDIFTDIFNDAPPLFEKPKEPKKSRNVNALFDDDSDDEALFFKKNDVITDDKPDFSPSEEKLSIFFDEPPAIDVDFTQKSNEHSQKPKINDSGHKVEEVDGFSIKPHLIDVKVEDDKPETTTDKDTQDITDNITKEPKKVGKLKPMNFNINVNTLLPGASPKKKQNENIDEQTASNEDLHTTEKVEPKMVKSISFDDPEILDNKISKERAKIQVKRRPSTRRARREAVRKSAIDLTDSSFDSSNDSSVKDNVKDTVVKTVYILNDEDIFGNATEKNDISGTGSTRKQLNIVDSDEELFKKSEQKDETDSKLNIDTTDSKLSKNDVFKANVESKSFLESDDDDLFKNKINKSTEIRNENLVKNEKNSFLDDDDDDDLFKQTTVKTHSNTVGNNLSKSSSITGDKSFSNTEVKSNEIKKVTKSKSFLDSDDNDDLFTNKNTQETTRTLKSNISSDDEELFTNSKKGIGTLGKVYETKDVPAKVENRTHSIFDDFPPKKAENVGNVNTKPAEVKETTKVEKPAFKSILDDSSDEDDLFKSKTKLATKKDAKSLFGDDGDIDDDLFGAKTVKEQKQDVLTPQTSKAAKSAEPVFADPLSLFENDE